MSKQEQNNRRTGIAVSILTHGLLLVFFFLFLAWTEPDPPIPDYGIEFNLGSSEIAEVQTDATDGKLDQEEQQDDPEVEEEVVEETVDQSEEATVQEQDTTKPVEEVSDPMENEAVDTEDINSPDVVEEVKDKVEKPVKESEKEDKSTTEDQKAVEDKELEKQNKTPEINEKAIYKGKSDAVAGGNKGASLDFSGWLWDFKPKPNDKSEESGKIVFEVTVDEEGEILGVRKIQSNISPAVEKKYRDAVMDLTFSRTSENRSTAATSKGRITFIIQSK